MVFSAAGKTSITRSIVFAAEVVCSTPLGLFDALDAARERLATSSYTITMSGGSLTTAFVDPDGEHFGGIGTDTGLDGRWT